MKPERAEKLKKLLEAVAAEYQETEEVVADAIAPALKYCQWHDRELAAFICSVLAYGRVEHIKKSISKLLEGMTENPHQWLLSANTKEIQVLTRGWCHRFNTEKDATALLLILQKIYQRHQSIEGFLKISHDHTAKDVIERFVVQTEALLKEHKWKVDKSFWFFFPKPSLGSACKRMNLYLRWMVGQSPQDFNLWKSMNRKHLMIPLDVHILNQARSLKLTKRKQADWKTVEEVTDKLRLLDPQDPTRFDFALCHLGMNGKILKASLLGIMALFFISCASFPETQPFPVIEMRSSDEKVTYDKDYEKLKGGDQTRLFQAIKTDSIVMAKKFFENGVDMNTYIYDSAGYATTPLKESITGNSQKVFRYLLEKGAKMDHLPNQIETELIVALLEKQESMALALLEKGANPNRSVKETKETPLMSAARLGLCGSVQKLIERKARVNAQNVDGYTALMYAAEEGYVACVTQLLAAGARKNLRNAAGKTAKDLVLNKNRALIQNLLK
ncbi:MAG: TIGR02757 family protein [Bdellovibrionales bacterium]